MTHHLVIMVKAPRMGRVKTRLARDIGAVAAWVFYRRTVSAITSRLYDPRWACWLSVSPDRARFQARAWPARWRRFAQGQGDLGARMLRPMAQLSPGPIVIIGADIPGIQSDHIAAAFTALKENNFVFGPATDGGFWLVGATRFPRLIDPFQGVAWSTDQALGETLANLPDGTRVGFLETLNDVDDARDLMSVL